MTLGAQIQIENLYSFYATHHAEQLAALDACLSNNQFFFLIRVREAGCSFVVRAASRAFRRKTGPGSAREG